MSLKKRIIPCLDVKDGRVVKGVSFTGLVDAGDPVGLAKFYDSEGADELCLLDITASSDDRDPVYDLIKSVALECSIPFSVGGSIKSLEKAMKVIESGADKVCVGSYAVLNPKVIEDVANRYGSQCVVVSIDAKKEADGSYKVYIKGGRERTEIDVVAFAKKVESLGAGEILLNSIDQDGRKSGFCTEILSMVSSSVRVPVIASGGAGVMEHFLEASLAGADALLAASVFHFGKIKIADLKRFLSQNKIDVRLDL
jgi:cyclase